MRFALMLFTLSIFAVVVPTRAQSDDLTHTMRIGVGAIQSVEWSPAGDLILVNTVTGAWLYSPELVVQRHLPDAHLATFSPTGRYLAAWDGVQNVVLWDTTTWETAATVDVSDVKTLAWSPNGRYVALFAAGRVWVWDFRVNWLNFGISVGGDILAWSPDSLHLAAFSTITSVAWVWNIEARTAIFVSNDDPARYRRGFGLQWRNSTQFVFIQDEDDIIFTYLNDIIDGTSRRLLGGTVSTFGLSNDGRYIAAGFMGRADVIDIETGELAYHYESPNDWFSSEIAWHPDGNQVAFGTSWYLYDRPARVIIVDLPTRQIIRETNIHRYGVRLLRWSPDQRTLLSVDHYGLMAILDLVDGQITTNDQHAQVSGIVAWDSGSQRLATADWLGGVHVWDMEQGLLTRLQTPTLPLTAMAWQPDGNQIALLAAINPCPCVISVWDTRSGATPVEIAPTNASGIRALAWHPDGSQLGMVGDELYLYRTQDWLETTVANHTAMDIQSMTWDTPSQIGFYGRLGTSTFSHFVYDFNTGYWDNQYPATRYAAQLDNHAGYVYDTTTYIPLFMLSEVQALAWSPDERWLALVRTDHQVWIVDAATGAIRYRVPAPMITPIPGTLLTYNLDIPTIVWSPDSRAFAHVYGGVVDVWTLP